MLSHTFTSIILNNSIICCCMAEYTCLCKFPYLWSVASISYLIALWWDEITVIKCLTHERYSVNICILFSRVWTGFLESEPEMGILAQVTFFEGVLSGEIWKGVTVAGAGRRARKEHICFGARLHPDARGALEHDEYHTSVPPWGCGVDLLRLHVSGHWLWCCVEKPTLPPVWVSFTTTLTPLLTRDVWGYFSHTKRFSVTPDGRPTVQFNSDTNRRKCRSHPFLMPISSPRVSPVLLTDQL